LTPLPKINIAFPETPALQYSAMYIDDDWPKVGDGSDYDGKQLLQLVRSGNNPFRRSWDVDLLIQEIETNLDTQVIDIVDVSKGSNSYVSSLLQSS
jgi:hypothetical protein